MSDVEIFQTAEFNLSDGKALAKSLQKLKDAKRKPIGAVPVYWSPEAEGEVKRVVFLRVVEGYNIPDYNDQEQIIQKNTAFFIEVEDETARILTCAATRLVSYFEEHGLPGGAYDLVYLGKIKNKTNNKCTLAGKWLRDAGFEIGEQVTVRVEEGRLIVGKADTG